MKESIITKIYDITKEEGMARYKKEQKQTSHDPMRGSHVFSKENSPRCCHTEAT